jgi:hypothetical protein
MNAGSFCIRNVQNASRIERRKMMEKKEEAGEKVSVGDS